MIKKIQVKQHQSNDSIWFFFLCLFMVVEYSRFYDLVNLGFIRPLMIMILILVFYVIRTGNLFKGVTRQISYMWLFILLLMAYVPFAKNNRYAFNTMINQAFYMPVIISIVSCVQTIDRLKKFLGVCVMIEIYVATYAIVHSGHGPGNYLFDENDLSLYINMWIPVCYYLFFFYRDFKNKLIYATGFITGMLAIIVSFSRGGFVGVVACMATIWFFSKKKIMTILVLGVVGLVAFTFVGDSYWKEMSTVTDTHEKTADERLLSWGAAWRMFLDNPLGVGGNNFQYHFSEYQGAGFKKVMWGRMAHSLWFTLISETGIVGIYLYLTILYFNIKDILFIVNFKTDSENDDIKYIKGLGCAFMASFAGYFASATFLSVLYYEHYWFMTGIIISTVTLFKRIENNQSRVA